MTRYLLYFSYLGTRFSGVQYQPKNITVQGVLTYALKTVMRIPHKAPVSFTLASRTDAGVHALMNAATVTLPPEAYDNGSSKDNLPEPILGINPDPPYDPKYLQAALNHLLWDLSLDVRVTGIRIVPDGFCPRRHAKCRSYLYRLAVQKPEYSLETEPALAQNPGAMAPLSEQHRSWAIPFNFNQCAFKDACSLLEGRHNFLSFTSTGHDNRRAESYTTVRNILLIDVTRGQSMMNPDHEPLADCFDYYDVMIVSRSFLFNQIRKMVSAMVAVAQSKLSMADLKDLLKKPCVSNFGFYDLRLAPSCGLYLKNIEYDPEDFVNPNPCYNHYLTDFKTRYWKKKPAASIVEKDSEEDLEDSDSSSTEESAIAEA